MAAAAYYNTSDMSSWTQPTCKQQDQLTDEIDEPSSNRGLGDAHTWRQIGHIVVKVAKALNDEDDYDDDSGSDSDSDGDSDSGSESGSDNEDEDDGEEQGHEEEEEHEEEEKKEHHFAASFKKLAGKLDKLAHKKKEKEAKEAMEQQHQHQAQAQAHPQPRPQPQYPQPHYTAYNPYSQGAQYQGVPRY